MLATRVFILKEMPSSSAFKQVQSLQPWEDSTLWFLDDDENKELYMLTIVHWIIKKKETKWVHEIKLTRAKFDECHLMQGLEDNDEKFTQTSAYFPLSSIRLSHLVNKISRHDIPTAGNPSLLRNDWLLLWGKWEILFTITKAHFILWTQVKLHGKYYTACDELSTHWGGVGPRGISTVLKCVCITELCFYKSLAQRLIKL